MYKLVNDICVGIVFLSSIVTTFPVIRLLNCTKMLMVLLYPIALMVFILFYFWL